jgi:intein/homing endonuclease
MNEKEKAIFLAGLFTGRGCFAVNRSHKGYLSFRIKFGSNSKEYLHQVRELLAELRIPNIVDKKDTIWILSFDGMTRFTKLVKPYLKYKTEELDAFNTAIQQYNDFLKTRFKQRKDTGKIIMEQAQPELDTIFNSAKGGTK